MVIVVPLFAEHREHALRHREAAEHVDRGERDARPPTASVSTRCGRERSVEIFVRSGAICTSAPIAMMLDTALVTLMSGVCSAGFTFHTTM